MSRGPRWTEIEHRKLRYMREVEKRPWAQITLPGRSSGACEVEYSARGFRHLAPAGPDAPTECAAPTAPKFDFTALRERAELRLRILECGLTGGVFGDPPPGRSALDQRRAAPAP
ncbi:hypothetical protein [Bradyrhizobium sp. ORS 86]|uniref:hypothetical protein n=1 Tax=Bradyrhizobium sp. ORS 86 TaxID=1685970 RepID=UPI00388F436D